VLKTIQILFIGLTATLLLSACGPNEDEIAQQNGFANKSQMKAYEAFGYKTLEDAKKGAIENGFLSPDEMLRMRNDGFKTRRDYVATQLSSPVTYSKACSLRLFSKKSSPDSSIMYQEDPALMKIYSESCLGHEVQWKAVIDQGIEIKNEYKLIYAEARENFNDDEFKFVNPRRINNPLRITLESKSLVGKCKLQGVAIDDKNAGGQMVTILGKITKTYAFDFKEQGTYWDKYIIEDISTCEVDPNSGPLVAKLAEDRRLGEIEKKKAEEEASRQRYKDQWSVKCTLYESTRQQCATAANYSQCMNIKSGSSEWYVLKDICPSR
jgi:hypothetical protein